MIWHSLGSVHSEQRVNNVPFKVPFKIHPEVSFKGGTPDDIYNLTLGGT